MTFKEYWDELMIRIPVKDGQIVKMTKPQLYSTLKNAFCKGFDSGNSKLKDVPKNNTNDIPDFFKDIFGKFKG